MPNITLFEKHRNNSADKVITLRDRKRYADTVKTALNLFETLITNKKNPQHYFVILQDVFGIHVNVNSENETDYAISDSVKMALTSTPEKTAISFLVFANMMIKNKIAMSDLSSGEIKLPEDAPEVSQQLINSLNEVINLLGEALNYRADYRDFRLKMNAALWVFLGSGAVAIIATALGGPVGVAIALGAALVAAVAILVNILGGILSPNKREDVESAMDDLKVENSNILLLLESDELKGFANLLYGNQVIDPNLDRTPIFDI